MSISWAVGVVHEDTSFASLAAYGAVCVTALVEWACFVLYGIEWALLMAAPANHTYALQTEQCVHCNSLQLTFRSQWVSRRSRSLFARHPSEDPPDICSSLEHGRNCQTTKTFIHSRTQSPMQRVSREMWSSCHTAPSTESPFCTTVSRRCSHPCVPCKSAK